MEAVVPIRLVKLGPYAFPHPTWSPDRHEIAFADFQGLVDRGAQLGVCALDLRVGDLEPPNDLAPSTARPKGVMPVSSADIWTYKSNMGTGVELVGFGVEAEDGSIGKIDEATSDVGSSYIVVDTGPWIFGKKVMLPAGVIDSVDADDEKVYVNRTKDEIKNAPEFDEDTYQSDEYRTNLGGYYGRERVGSRDSTDLL